MAPSEPPRSAFDRLSPALRYQVVNQLGWSDLRPVQEAAIEAVLDEANCVVVAPTAGGKTEAAVLPVLARMDAEDWPGGSVLYVVPIRALLNNLEPRLQTLCGLVGRSAFVWHGDVGPSARRRAIEDRVDVIGITPESLEALMLSSTLAADEVLRQVRAVIVDEVHAFAADDRGGHLMALLERVSRIACRDLQRIGLSATVGNPEEIVAWLSGSSTRDRRVVDHTGGRVPAELAVDFVGGLENAAMVIAALHPGRKRLVFADSRRRVEELARNLRDLEVETFVSHSSLALSERRAAERAFAEGESCVIVATSALELGIDVGDLDHVLQIDAPSSVAAFLQRMGRTGRRAGTRPNCTFLATSKEAVLQAAALVRLYEQGYVEPIRPDRAAYHLLVHQMLSLALQESGVAADAWWWRVDGAAPFADITAVDREALLQHLRRGRFLELIDGRLVLGEQGERTFGRRHFQELYAVFSTPPELRVVWGEKDLGMIDLAFLETESRGEVTFVLAGRPWRIDAIDWRRGVCHVVPAEDGKAPRWAGAPRFLAPVLCRAIREVLTGDTLGDWLSRRARAALTELREEHADLPPEGVHLREDEAGVEVWTFFGGLLNRVLARLLEDDLGVRVAANNLRLTVSTPVEEGARPVREALTRALPTLLHADRDHLATLAATAFHNHRLSKFEVCLPEHYVGLMHAHRIGRCLGEVGSDVVAP